MVVPVLGFEEYQFGDTGVKLNDDPVMPFVDILSVDGLDNAPVRMSSSDREGMDGGLVDSQYETSRTVTIQGEIYAVNTALETYLDTLKANFAPTKLDVPLYFGLDGGGVRCVFGKSQGMRFAKEQDRRLGKINFQVQIACGDPRIYNPTPVTHNFVSGAGAANITLSGNRQTNGILTINGPSTNPVITHGTKTMTFNITLVAGDKLVIDLENRTVILNGTTNKRSTLTLTGGWYLLDPGNNSFSLTGGGSLDVEAKSAWR